MTVLDSTSLTIIRDGHPHSEKFYMSVLKPEVLYVGQVAGTPVKGDRQVTTTDVSGSIGSVQVGQTMEVYDPGTGDVLSKRRIRSRAGNVFTLDENNVPWTTALRVRVLHTWELWSVFPYINPTTFEFFKARDNVYVDQNDKIPPVAILSCQRAAFLAVTSVTLQLNGSSSYAMAVAATITTYYWTCNGGTISNSAIANPTITFTTAGQYWLSLDVTDSNDKHQTTRVPIFIHTRTGADAPYEDFELTAIDSTWQDGGGNCTVTVTGAADPSDFPDDTAVIIWSEQYYKGSEQYFGAGHNTALLGYIKAETVAKTATTGSVQFQIEEMTGLMKRRKMTSISIEDSNDTPTWYRFPAGTLTVARAIHHYWKWHSTLFDICNVFLPVGITKLMDACDDFEAGTLYDMADRFVLENGIFAHTVCTTYGDIHMEQDINVLSDAARASTDVLLTVTPADRTLDPDLGITLRKDNVSTVTVSGTSKTFAGALPVPIISTCPGDTPDTYGQSDVTYERQVLLDQTEANYLSGRLYAMHNAPIEELSFTFSGNYPIELVPQSWLEMSGGSTKRMDIDGMRFAIRSLSIRIDTQAGTRQTSVTAVPEAIAVVGDGVTIVPPDPDPSPDPTSPNLPPVTLPIFPPPPGPPGNTKPPILPSCGTTDDPNGPWNLYISGDTLDSDAGPTSLSRVHSCKLRPSTDPNPSGIILTGSFWQEVSGALALSNENNFYEVVAKDPSGNVVAEAIMSGSGSTRQGVFNNPAAVWITTIEISITPSHYEPGDLITWNIGDRSQPGDTGTFEWGIGGSGDVWRTITMGWDSRVEPLRANPFGLGACCIAYGTSSSIRVQFDYSHSANRGLSFNCHLMKCPGGTHVWNAALNEAVGSVDETFYVVYSGAPLESADAAGLQFTLYKEAGESFSITNARITAANINGCDAGRTRITISSAFLYNLCK